MKKYQVYECGMNYNHAGSKATADIEKTASAMGYETIEVRMMSDINSLSHKLKRQIRWVRDWQKVYSTVENNSIVLLQCPFHHRQINRKSVLMKLKKNKNVRYICVIHDVEKLRGFRYNKYYEEEFAFMMEIADAIIVHNDVMKQYFRQFDIPESRLISLEIFDYLQEPKEHSLPAFEKSITVAGNLDTSKCGYISGLAELKNIEVNLYGPNFDERMADQPNIHYHGSFPSSEIPDHLTKGFGLVWDGAGIHGCTGESGQYLRYNNPHKLSLYLSSGLPAVIWKGAAEAQFVEKNGVGITVDDLAELDQVLGNMTETEYTHLAENTAALSEKLRNGRFAESAISKAATILEEGLR